LLRFASEGVPPLRAAAQRAAFFAPRLAPFLLHLVAVLWLFGEAILGSRVFYYRDLATQYYPDYVFLERSLQQGVWPLWNPHVDAGVPVLFAYPLEVACVWLLGAGRALAISPPLHLLLAMCGASVLARELGQGGRGAWLAGAVYGLSGYCLSSVNLLQLLHAAAWAPCVLAVLLQLLPRPTWARASALALCAALQISTLSAETCAQTAVAAAFLVPWRIPGLRAALPKLLTAASLAALLAAPALLGAPWLLRGGRRAQGLGAQEILAYSGHPLTLAEAALPRFFGDVHAFSDAGYWGQPFFPEGSPYFLSLYLGPAVLLLGACARSRRLFLLALLGILLSLGSHGPLRPLLVWVTWWRGPIKFFFLTTLALALAAGLGLERASRAAGRGGAVLAPGAVLTLLGVALHLWPEIAARALAVVVPELLRPRAAALAGAAWPAAWLSAGALCLAAGLALQLPAAWRLLAGAICAVDLLAVNAPINALAPASFYELRPSMRALLARAQGDGRIFSYGVAYSPPLPWAPDFAARASDAALFYFDRQTLLPRTHVLDGRDGAFDVDRTGWAPPGATLPVHERDPRLYARHHPLLRLASVRWILSFAALPQDLATLRATTRFPEILAALGLYESDEALPRAFFVRRAEFHSDPAALRARMLDRSFDPTSTVLLEAPAAVDHARDAQEHAPGPASVVLERTSPHLLRVSARTPAGYLVVSEGHADDWRVTGPEGASVPLRANGRYWAIATPGGARSYVARYEPRWRTPALLMAALGVAVASALGFAGRARG
jgi:hypothetical protein